MGMSEISDGFDESKNRGIKIGLSYALGGRGDSSDTKSKTSSKSKRSSSTNAKSSESDSEEILHKY